MLRTLAALATLVVGQAVGGTPAMAQGAPTSFGPDGTDAVGSAEVGLAWQRVADRDLVSYPRNGSMYGVIPGGPGAVAWGYVYGTGPRIWATADGRDWTPADVEVPPDGAPEYPGDVLDIARDDATFVAVGSYAPVGRDSVPLIWTSDEGLIWRLIPDASPFAHSWLTEVVAWRGGFLVYGYQNIGWDEPGPPRTWTSADGISWDEVTMVLPEGAERVTVVDPGNDRLWGLATYPPAKAGRLARLRRVDSLDGLTWTISPLRRIGRYEQLHPLPDGLYVTVTAAKRPQNRAPLGVYRSGDSVTWTPLVTGRLLGREITAVGDTLVMVGSKGTCDRGTDECVAAAWRSLDGGNTWRRAPVSGTPRWASRAWMTQAAALPDGTVVAVGTELKGMEPSTAAWVSIPARD